MKKILISFILLLMFSASAYAADGGVVDLTEFAEGSGDTHSHVWLDKYDADNHWQECQLCATKQNVTVHSLSVKYTIGEDSCNPNNYKITSCNNCNYNTRQLSQTEHEFVIGTSQNTGGNQVFDENGAMITYKIGFFCLHCSAVSDPYDITDSEGNPIDLRTMTEPTGIYVNGVRVRTQAVNYPDTYSMSEMCETTMDYEFIDNYTKLKVNYTTKINENVPFSYTQEKLLDGTATFLQLLFSNLNGASGRITKTGAYSSFDEDSRLLKGSLIVDITDITKDSSVPIRISPIFRFRIWNAEKTFCSEYYRNIPAIQVYTNVFEPEINEVTI